MTQDGLGKLLGIREGSGQGGKAKGGGGGVGEMPKVQSMPPSRP